MRDQKSINCEWPLSLRLRPSRRASARSTKRPCLQISQNPERDRAVRFQRRFGMLVSSGRLDKVTLPPPPQEKTEQSFEHKLARPASIQVPPRTRHVLHPEAAGLPRVRPTERTAIPGCRRARSLGKSSMRMRGLGFRPFEGHRRGPPTIAVCQRRYAAGPGTRMLKALDHPLAPSVSRRLTLRRGACVRRQTVTTTRQRLERDFEQSKP